MVMFTYEINETVPVDDREIEATREKEQIWILNFNHIHPLIFLPNCIYVKDLRHFYTS